jgi:prephenate dehydrogenase
LSAALSRGALDRALDGPELENVDLVVLASPLSQIVERLRSLDSLALVTDVAGVKGPVLAAAAHLPRFVGGHPMAGGATSGPGMASSRLFHGASWVITTDGADEDDLLILEEVIKSLGANPLRMTASAHDHAVALISHLPHILAALLMRMGMSDPGALALAGGGFRDLTRVAGSDTAWWTEVLAANSDQLGQALFGLQEAMETVTTSLAADDRVSIGAILEHARIGRSSLGEHHAQVRVVLHDRPGEIARVGHALENCKADVRDFQLRHGEHGGGGILTISVSPATADTLRQSLRKEGFELEP